MAFFRHIDIENVRGYCTARCPMCTIAMVKDRPKVMSGKEFQTIIDCFLPVVDKINSITLVGMGEALIDTGLIAKIKYLKSKGLKNVCLPTNASHLNRNVSQGLLNAELDQILFGVDSLDKETYENIRKQLVFEDIMRNVHRFIEMRNQGHFQTRIFVRMVVQMTTAEQWDDYKNYWAGFLDFQKGDMVLSFPIHNFADAPEPIGKDCTCSYIFDRMVINAYGNVQFCDIDVEADFFNLGNVFEKSPIDIFNNETFTNSRRLMDAGEINEINPCKYCNVPLKRPKRQCYVG